MQCVCNRQPVRAVVQKRKDMQSDDLPGLD